MSVEQKQIGCYSEQLLMQLADNCKFINFLDKL